MPYLDGGEILRKISARVRQPIDATRITRVLARAMLELERESWLDLEWRGDAISGLKFPKFDTQPGGTLVGVTLH